MTAKQKIASVLAALAVLAAATVKILNGEAPNVTEAMLAISTVLAAFGFQKG